MTLRPAFLDEPEYERERAQDEREREQEAYEDFPAQPVAYEEADDVHDLF